MKPSISFKNVSKKYRIGRDLPTIRDWVTSIGKKPNPKQFHWAVNDVSFELQPGESLGIIGPNGAGKTTILKLLSQVTAPTSGSININGRFSALIELGAGFHPDLTGRENVYLNGTILGLRRAEIRKRFDEIVEFSGISQFIDTPVKRYSSGMYARLGFSVAAHIEPEVFLVDEVLAVGDYAFQMKCYNRMDELREKGTSLIFVSHNMEVVRRVCDRGMVMYRGNNIFQGTSSEAVVAFSDALRNAARQESKEVKASEDGLTQRVMTFDAEIEKVTLLNGDGKPTSVLHAGDPATIAVDFIFNKDVKEPVFAFEVRTTDGRIIYDDTTRWMGVKTPSFSAGDRCRVEYKIDDLNLLEGSYELGTDIAAHDLSHYYDRMERATGFFVKNPSNAEGLLDFRSGVNIVNQSTNQVLLSHSVR